MAKFTIRVELHDADDDDYETLHEEMEKRGFSKTITGSDNITYHLPTAEYNRDCDLSRDQVRDSASVAAKVTGKRHAVLVTESNGRSWVGLDKVE